MTEKHRPIEWVVGVTFWVLLALGIIAAVIGYADSNSSQTPTSPKTSPGVVSNPYPGYQDGIDQDCPDLLPRKNIYIGSYDPDNLDRDGDGWACEG
jgi:hypothetical protein